MGERREERERRDKKEDGERGTERRRWKNVRWCCAVKEESETPGKRENRSSSLAPLS